MVHGKLSHLCVLLSYPLEDGCQGVSCRCIIRCPLSKCSARRSQCGGSCPDQGSPRCSWHSKLLGGYRRNAQGRRQHRLGLSLLMHCSRSCLGGHAIHAQGCQGVLPPRSRSRSSSSSARWGKGNTHGAQVEVDVRKDVWPAWKYQRSMGLESHAFTQETTPFPHTTPRMPLACTCLLAGSRLAPGM